ncbi:MAG: SMP-30/gluconolactonase/LRE family protein [Oligoflexus sp.]|nr:SMP-30/gluconolactonase/LRE family protein [Oligoflexus sp.]
MKKSKRSGFKTILLLIAVIIILLFGGKTLFDAGEFDTVWDHPLPDCRLLALAGAEDMTLVDEQKRALISAGDRQGLAPGQKSGVYLYEGSGSPNLIYETEGHPHGISSIETELGTRVFLVVHKAQGDVVQILDWNTSQLTVVKEVPFEDVRTLNGIVAIDSEKFFVSQDLGMGNRLGQELEKLLRLPLGKLWLYDGRSPRVVKDSLLYPNGLALSPDRKILYLASTLGRSLIVFDYEPTTFSVKWRDQFALRTAPDNLKWAGERLLIGSHPQLFHLMAHSIDPLRFKAPSQLIALDGLPGKPKLVELYSTKEGPLSAVASGVFLKDRVIMGTVFDKGVLDCARVAEGMAFPLGETPQP